MRRIVGLLAAAMLLVGVATTPVNAAAPRRLVWTVQIAVHNEDIGRYVTRAVEIRLYEDATGTYEYTNVMAPSATHWKWTFTWTTGDGVSGPNSLIQTGGTIYITDTKETIEFGPRDTGVVLVPGHYDGVWVYGLEGPGIRASIQVNEMP